MEKFAVNVFLGVIEMGRICPKCGNTLDTTWVECPYCKPMKIKPSTSPHSEINRKNSNEILEESKPESTPGKSTRERRTVIKDSFRSPGYTITQDDAEIPLMGWIVVIKGNESDVGKDYSLRKERTLIGANSSKCDIVINDDMVSSEHCAIRVVRSESQRKIHINDLGSRNGTIVNNEKCDGADLFDGDRIKLGKTVLFFRVFDPILFET